MKRGTSPPRRVDRMLWPAVVRPGATFACFELTNAGLALPDRLHDPAAHRWLFDVRDAV